MADSVTVILRRMRETKGTIVYVDENEAAGDLALKGLYLPRALAKELSSNGQAPERISLTFEALEA